MTVLGLVKSVNEFGPSVMVFSVGLWGIINVVKFLLDRIKKSDDEIKKAEQIKDQYHDSMVSLLIKKLDEREDFKQKKHDEDVQYRKKVIRLCNNYALEMLKELNADSVAIYDYCNGTSSLSGIPFLHFKVIAKKEDVTNKKAVYNEKLDINILGTFLLDLEKEQQITIKDIRKNLDKYPELGHVMQLNKKTKGVFANVVGTNSSLGFISITFQHNKKVDYAKAEKVIYSYVQKISNLLDFQNINQ